MGNYQWLANHAISLCIQYNIRFGKTHACQAPIMKMDMMDVFIKGLGRMTPFVQAMPDEYKHEDAVTAYRAYYHSKADSPGGVHYRHTSPPRWWMEVTA